MKKTFLLIAFLTLIGKTYAQNEGDAFFGAAMVHEVKLTFHQSNYWDSLENAYIADVYILGDVEIDGSPMPDCGVKFKGNSSYNNPSTKKSWKLDFNEFVNGQDYDGLKKLNLNNCFKDPSFLREKLMLDFLNFRGLPAPRCTYAKVFVNGTYWGLYTAVEEIDKTYLSRTFGDKKGNLFKGDPSGDLKWLGSAASNYYPKYELKTNETLNDWTDLIQLIDKINNTATNVLPDTLSNYFELDTYYETWAAHILFSNLDSYLGSGHNYYLYHDSLINKIHFITWDVNEAFGNFNQGMSVSQIESMNIFYVPTPAGNRPLHEKLLLNNVAKQKLADAICDMVNYDFSIWTLEAKIDSLANAIRPHVYADNLKFFTNQNFEDNIEQTITVMGTPGGNNIPGIKSFLINRRNSVASQLASWGCSVGISEKDPDESIVLYPNPVTDQLTIQGLANGIWTYEIIDLTGRIVHTAQVQSNHLDLSYIKTGSYLIRLNNEETKTSHIRKFLKL